jgi:hypothetical protein
MDEREQSWRRPAAAGRRLLVFVQTNSVVECRGRRWSRRRSGSRRAPAARSGVDRWFPPIRAMSSARIRWPPLSDSGHAPRPFRPSESLPLCERSRGAADRQSPAPVSGSSNTVWRVLTIARWSSRAARALAERREDGAEQASCRLGARCRSPIGGAPAAVACRDGVAVRARPTSATPGACSSRALPPRRLVLVRTGSEVGVEGACSQSLAKHQRWPVGGWRLLLGESSSAASGWLTVASGTAATRCTRRPCAQRAEPRPFRHWDSDGPGDRVGGRAEVQ